MTVIMVMPKVVVEKDDKYLQEDDARKTKKLPQQSYPSAVFQDKTLLSGQDFAFSPSLSRERQVTRVRSENFLENTREDTKVK